MILYIAEKPSLGRALAEVLPKPHKKGDGFITLGNGDVVSWCIGHLLEQAQPDAYDAKYKQWHKSHLPIIPSQWKLSVKPKTRKQFSTLKKLIKEAKQLVNVGDPDREGQILIDEVINHCKASKAKILSAKRCLISDLNPQAVKRSLENLRPNTDFIPLATSALARTRADWLYGINMTRLCTVQGKQSGFKGVLSVGRVQTPLLGLVVKRDEEIKQFISKPFYELNISLQTQHPYNFKAKWQPSDACQPYMDDEGRVLSSPLVHNVASRVIHQEGLVSHFSAHIKKQAPPLPYNLSSLQIDAAKRFRLSAKEVLDICQQLYERHKLITYPRSDCRYLPSGHFAEATQVIKAIGNNTTAFADFSSVVNPQQKSKAWNDKKISAHHAIIPTAKSCKAQSLVGRERDVYQLIARQYLMQFLPSFDYREIKIDCDIAGGVFISKRKEIIALGWKLVFESEKKKTQDSSEDNPEDHFSHDTMPHLKKGDSVRCTDTHISNKNTTAPKHFNDASLLAAMTGIARYVKDPKIRKILRETDGLGTEATRAGIIELLFTREFLHRKGKDILATDIGRELITHLPEHIALPDMTAQWESQLNAISQKEMAYQQFMSPMTGQLQQLINELGDISFDHLAGKSVSTKRGAKRSSGASNNRYKKSTYKKSAYKKQAPKKAPA